MKRFSIWVQMLSTMVALTAVFASALNFTAAHAATITSEGCQFCSPHGVSNDGSVIAGELARTSYFWDGYELLVYASGGSYPLMWTQQGGFKLLEEPGYLGSATAVTPDGSIVVGSINGGTSFSGGQLPSVPFRWTEATGLVSLHRPPGVSTAGAFGMSADGSTVMIQGGSCGAGGCYPGIGPIYRWTQADSFVSLGFSGLGRGVSADGSVVVGITAGPRAFRWSADTGVVDLGSLNDAISSDAHAVSADGSVVVGGSGGHAFRWTAATGMVDLGAGGTANAVSAEGSVVVGGPDYPQYTNTAFYWTQAGGMRLLTDVLQNDYSLDMSGWRLDQALAMSADGRIIVGRGYSPTGYGVWLVDLSVSEPSSLAPFAVGSACLFAWTRRRDRQTQTFTAEGD